MRWPARRRFETYRKQAQSLKLDDETRERTLRVIRSLEEREQDRTCAAATTNKQAFPAPTTTKTAIPALKSPNRRKRSRVLGVPFKAAACVVLTVGLAAVAIAGISPAVDEERSMATASSPLYPYQRVQFDFNMLALYTLPTRGVYAITPTLLCLPGNLPEHITLTVQNSHDVIFSPTESDEYLKQGNGPMSVTTNHGKIWLFASYLTDITYTEMEEGRTVPDGWWWDPTEAVELIERLRDCEIIVETDAGERFVYTLNFDDRPTREAVTASLYAKQGIPSSYFNLERKEPQ